MAGHVVLEVRKITKRFPGVLANDQVSFDLRAGEIHALLGENGAGKSTLMNILFGLYSPDEGEIALDLDGKGGLKPVKIQGPQSAIAYGINMVHQHFMLVPVFTVTENIVLGDEITRGPVLDNRAARSMVSRLSQDYGLAVDPEALIEDLPVGVQQRVEILKALYRHTRILVLDEPTAVLTPQEVNDLFKVLRQLTERGVSVIFITHKLKEVLTIADRVTVMRQGRVVGSLPADEASEPDLAAMMVGRAVMLKVEKSPAEPADIILDVNNLSVRDDRGLETVRGVSFQVRAGEILGLAGVQGNGQTELVEALTGLRAARGGRISLCGDEMPFLHARRMVEAGLAHIPEDRRKHGLILPYSIAENQVLCTYYRPPFARGIRRLHRQVNEQSHRLIEQFDIRAPGPWTAVENLSGGNQQKVILSREFSREVRLLVANQPTRGLDVGSIEYIHSQIVALRDRGAAVLLVSTELDEIFSLSDRILVMFRGELSEPVFPETTAREEIGLRMAGVNYPGAQQ